jgi:hypothetical protein
LTCAFVIAFAASLFGVARQLERTFGSRLSLGGPAVLLAVWAIARGVGSFVNPYRELSFVAAASLPLALAVLWSGRALSHAHALLAPMGIVAGVLLLGAFASLLFPLEHSAGLQGEIAWSDPTPMSPGGLVFLLGLGAAALWFASVGIVFVTRSRTFGSGLARE